MSKYYITTTLPYVNSDPHIGFALEIVQADVLARYHALMGDEVVFNTGTDEHGLKIFRKAEENGEEVQAYCDRYAAKFNELGKALNLSYTNFIRTTDPAHIAAAQEFWNRCLAAGDIYKKNYQIKYCVGCELEKTDSDLVNDHCPLHPNLEIEMIDEENYFFRFSKFQQPLLDFYASHPDFVVPDSRFNEIKAFVGRGLEDFSISRLKSKMPWGIAVPGDDTQVMYVWFDALINYISTLSWPKGENFNNFWPGVQVAGKDNLRQQTAMWQAMLLSAGISPSKQVFIHGYVTADGQKMSKSLGNVVNPFDMVGKYGTDAVRYYLLGAMSSYEDGDWSEARFRDFFGAHLANGVGNLTQRVVTMVEKYCDSKVPEKSEPMGINIADLWSEYDANLDAFRFDELVARINRFVKNLDQDISTDKPWERAKRGEDVTPALYRWLEGLRHLGIALLPVLPETANKILAVLGVSGANLSVENRVWGKLEKSGIITKGEPLFPRLS